MQTIQLELGDRSYPIFIGREKTLFKRFSSLQLNPPPVLITSPQVRRHCLPLMKKWLPRWQARLLEIPDGEKFKTLQTAEQLYRRLTRLGADRNTPLLLLGGGVVGDIGGFVAATYLRGVPYIHIPTTLIAQIDSSIGGKVAVDLPEGKNLVGAFYQPRAVLAYLPFLRSLPLAEFRAGMAEAIKCGLIQDPALFKLICREGSKMFSSNANLEALVVRSARIKAKIVSKDERETSGLRRLLNFGHTFGHALERLTRYRRYRHGEAVAIGMIIAARLSARLGIGRPELEAEIREVLQQVQLPVDPPSFSRREWLEAIQVDKKRDQGMIQFVFLRKIGAALTRPVAPAMLVKLL